MAPRGASPDAEGARRAQLSLEAIEAGGLPLAAQERLDEVRRRGDRFFTSDLSVNEFLLVREAGFRPITQVMGSCFYQVGWQMLPGRAGMLGTGWGYQSTGETYELEQQTAAWNDARQRALDRLSEEAHRAGADAVVGVRLQRGRYDWAAGLIEFVATGTAVRSERFALGDEPALSNLSGQEFSSLFRHGYWPAGLVAGSTVAYVASGAAQQYRSRGLLTSMTNQEMPDFSQGVYDARALAMDRVTRQAHALHAHGVIGVDIETSHREIERGGGTNYTDLIVELHVLGTAIVELDLDQEHPEKYLDLQLNDRGDR